MSQKPSDTQLPKTGQLVLTGYRRRSRSLNVRPNRNERGKRCNDGNEYGSDCGLPCVTSSQIREECGTDQLRHLIAAFGQRAAQGQRALDRFALHAF